MTLLKALSFLHFQSLVEESTCGLLKIKKYNGVLISDQAVPNVDLFNLLLKWNAKTEWHYLLDLIQPLCQ